MNVCELSAPFTRKIGTLMGPRGCLFTFHRCAPDSVWGTLPNRNFYLNLEFLDALITYLTIRGWDIVTLDEAVRRTQSPALSRKFVNFSIDDCYRDTYEAVVPLFRRHGVPVTLFVTTGIPDGTLPMWPSGLEDVLMSRDQIVTDDRVIAVGSVEAKRAAYEHLAALWDGPDAGAIYARFCGANGVDPEALHWKHAISWDMLAALRYDPLFEIGAHTVSHPRISSLPVEQVRGELAGSRARLESRLQEPVRHFAFPYGRAGDCGPRDFEIIRELGFTSAATTRKGLVRAGQPLDHLPRITLNGGHQTMGIIEAHLTGLTALVAGVLGRV